MTTRSMGKGITLTRDMYKRMGRKTKQMQQRGLSVGKGGRILPHTSNRMDPRSHVRFS